MTDRKGRGYRVECKKCGSTWKTADKIRIRMNKCPFCGEMLSEEKTIEMQLGMLIREDGTEVLKNSVKINGILADYFPKYIRERASIKAALEIGIGKKFYEMANNWRENPGVELEYIRKRLIEEAWLSDKASEYVCTVFVKALNSVFSEEEADSVIQDDTLEAKTYFSPENQYHMGLEMLEKGEHQLAEKWFREIKDNGEYEAIANVHLGDMYENEPEIAIKYYIRAAELGNHSAQNNVGYMYETGEGVKADLPLAIKMYHMAADGGNRAAQHNLGYLYYIGKGVPQDYDKAYKWFLKAAGQKSPAAQNNIGVMFEYGQGVSADLEQALWWYQKSAENGNEDAASNYARLKETLKKRGLL